MLYWIYVVFEMNGKYLHRVRVVQKFEISMGWDVCLKIPPEISKDRDVCFLADNPMLKLY